MRRTYKESIEFPANPFVAFADFILMTLVVVTLGFIYQSVYSKEVIQRIAVQNLQKHLRDELRNSIQNSMPEGSNLIREVPPDGDLQRFTFDGSYLYEKEIKKEATSLTKSGRMLLTQFGQLLHKYEGDVDHPGHGLFKRISVQGNCDASEGDDDTVWRISQARAREVAEILQRDCKINGELIEATGRGSWDKSTLSRDSLKNRRVDIVVYYSGVNAVEFEKLIH